jgi:xanthine dehydrogenase accessory factor
MTTTDWNGNDWSTPETTVFERIRTALDDGAEAVLATVIAVDGSAYRRPGARMLLWPDGGGVGSITAGCLEDEVRELASDVLAGGVPRVESWDLTGDDDVWGLGVGCNGVITVLLEPLGDSYRPVVEARNDGEAIGIATVTGGDADVRVGTRAHYHPDRGFVVHEGGDDVGDGDFPTEVLDELTEPAAALVEGGDAETLTVETSAGSVEVFVDGVRPPPELVVFGSGHDVTPVVELATRVDFRVTVVTFRGGRADSGDFAGADEVRSTSPGDVAALREWTADTNVVVMTHNFLDDRIALEQLLETPVEYIGLMGPRKRFAEMCEDLAAEGRPITDAERDRIYTPIGLNLGGDSPNRIAFSIVAEVLAVSNDRTPEHLSDRTDHIHDRVDLTAE